MRNNILMITLSLTLLAQICNLYLDSVARVAHERDLNLMRGALVYSNHLLGEALDSLECGDAGAP